MPFQAPDEPFDPTNGNPSGFWWKGNEPGAGGTGLPPWYQPPGGGGFFGGGSGGSGAGGGLFRSPGYNNITAYDPTGAGRRKMLKKAPAASAWMGGGTAAASGSYPAPSTGGGGGDYWDLLMSRINSGTAAPTDFNALAMQAIAGNGRGGIFEAGGNPAVLAAMERRLKDAGGERMRSAILGAQLDAPNDFYAQGLARTMARAGAANTTAQTIGDYQVGAAQQYDDLIRNLLMNQLGDYSRFKGEQFSNSQREAQQNAQNRANAWQLGGQLVGAGIGAFTGGGRRG